MFRIIIAGSRSFNNYAILKGVLDSIISKHDYGEIVIVSGGARGADKLGERYAAENNYQVTQFIPDWNIGKHAGMLRNEDMAKNADALVAFWDQKSNGTRGMINLAKRYNLKFKVVNYKERILENGNVLCYRV